MEKQKIREFWNQQALKYGYSVKAVNFDPLEEDLEFYFLESLIPTKVKLLDFGCGNGRTLFFLAQKRPRALFVGVDFSKNMINLARQNNCFENIDFFMGDVLSKSTIENLRKRYKSFDYILTKRLLINLHGISKKKKALENIWSLLKQGGTYIMIECFLEPLERINEIRLKLDLPIIKVKKFNEYLKEDFLLEIEVFFKIKKVLDFESNYYFISRIFNAYLSQGEPDYFAEINKLAVTLTKMGITFAKDYGPEKILILEKK